MIDAPEVLAYLGLGSNLGDRQSNLAAALDNLANPPILRVLRRSQLYESEPWGVTDQPWFLNQVLEIKTSLAPRDLLARLKQVEHDLGRQPSRRWGERLIDLDILLYGQQQVGEPDLVIPHPHLWERLFVLLPLAELQPELRSPDGQTIQQVVGSLAGSSVVRPLKPPDPIRRPGSVGGVR
jgi:2-amino-4-hydroxy-6-hydroxymethyldihydropteridine diphosphokinase